MPVILAPEDYSSWLDAGVSRTDRLLALLKPYPAEAMQLYPVSTLVNSPDRDTVECQQQIALEPK